MIIQLNEEQHKVSKFEKINHYYVLCKNDLDKYGQCCGFKGAMSPYFVICFITYFSIARSIWCFA